MPKIAYIFVFYAYLVTVLADPDRSGKFLNHDPTVINCARYKREAYQHQCVLSPFTTEGPYFLPDDLQRSDITDGQTGIQYNLTIVLVNSNDCSPLENMFVHVWHANAIGEYSGVRGMGLGPKSSEGHSFHGHRSFGHDKKFEWHSEAEKVRNAHRRRPKQKGRDATRNGRRPTPVSDERFLRGYQVTNQNGSVNFNTILPGWYAGRAIHIHIEVYPRNTTEKIDISYVGQIFFKDNLPESLKPVKPYSENPNRITLNENDGIYKHGHGDQTTAQLEVVGSSSFKSTMIFGIDPDAHTKSQV